MTNFKQRLTILEGMRTKADIQAMSDAELDVHISTLEFGTTECYSACITRVMRHPSTFPVARGETDYQFSADRQTRQRGI